MKYRIYVLFFLLILTGCFNYFENAYHRIGKESTYFQKSYEPIDTIRIEQIRFCKKLTVPPDNKFKTKGEIRIGSNSIEQGIVKSLKKEFKYVDYELEKDTSWKLNCDYLTRSNLLSNQYPNLTTLKGYSTIITLDIDCFSGRDSYVDGFYGGRGEILDHDKYEIKFLLRLAMFKNKELIYMDNYGHLVILMTEHDEKKDYEISQNIIDSLVTKSLAEYHKR